jgi:hypothetical protein
MRPLIFNRLRNLPIRIRQVGLAFAKLKAHLRQAAARTLEDLYSALASSLDSFSPTHCRAFFRHANYASI